MSSNLESLRRQAKRLCEEGRLLWLLGRGLDRASCEENTKELGPWALETLRELRGLESSGTQQLRAPRQTRRVEPAVKPESGAPVVVWVASCAREGNWTSLAIGCDVEGYKSVLSVQPGSTTNPAVCEALIEDLENHELPADKAILLVTDGSLILEDTLSLKWTERPMIAHCRSTVRKAVLGHLPRNRRVAVSESLKSAWSSTSVQAAEKALDALVKSLEEQHPGAAERLSRCLKETLTVDKLGVTSRLREHLALTGVVRTAFESAVKSAGSHAESLEAGLLEWCRQTRRVPGFRELPELCKRLRQYHQEKEQAASQSLTSKDAAHH